MNTTLKDAAEVAKDAADATVHRIGDLVGDLTDLVGRPKATRDRRPIWLGAVALVVVAVALVMLRGRRSRSDAAEDISTETHRPAAARRSEVAVS